MADILSTFARAYSMPGAAAEANQQARDTRTVRSLAPQAISGDPQAQAQVAAIDPQAAAQFGAQRNDLLGRTRMAAQYLQNAIKANDPAAIAAARQQIKPFMDTLNPQTAYPLDRDPAQELPQIEAFLAQTAGLAQNQQGLAPRVVGDALVDSTGKVLYQAPSQQEYQWSDRAGAWIPKPGAGGAAPASGPRPPVVIDPTLPPEVQAQIRAAEAAGQEYTGDAGLSAIPVAGIGPKPDASPLDLERLAMERRRLQLAEQSANNAPSGFRWGANGALEAIPGGPADPAAKSQSKGAPTEGERKSATLLMRMEGSLGQLNNALARNPGAATPGVMASVAGALPFVGDTARNVANSTERQQVENAQLDILDAALTLGTGAAYTKEQLRGYAQSYFPQLGDDPATVRDKADRLKNVISAARIAAGRAGPAAESAVGTAPSPAAAPSNIDALLDKYR